MFEEEVEIKIDETKNESMAENNDKPFVKMDNIDEMSVNNKDQNNNINQESKISKKPSEITEEDNNSESSNTESESSSRRENEELNLNAKELYEESKKKLEPYHLNMKNTIKNIEEMVRTGERQRNYKIKSEFEREKEYKLEEQDEIKNKIIELSKNNINEKLISHFNIRINQQEELYTQFDEMKADILNKIELIKSAIPSLEKKCKRKK